MLSYKQQYDISNGVFITYDSQLDKRLLHSRHGSNVRENTKNSFPHSKYENMTKENFVMTCVFIMFDKSPSSFRAMLSELYEVNEKDVYEFKHKIMNYNDYIGKDITFLKETFGHASYQQVFRSLVDKKIEFYTAWFYVLFNPEVNRETIRKSRSLAHILRKLEFIMKFLTFRTESVARIKELFVEIEL